VEMAKVCCNEFHVMVGLLPLCC